MKIWGITLIAMGIFILFFPFILTAIFCALLISMGIMLLRMNRDVNKGCEFYYQDLDGTLGRYLKRRW